LSPLVGVYPERSRRAQDRLCDSRLIFRLFRVSREEVFTTEFLERRSRNQNSEYLPQRRKGRKEIKLPNLAFLASWREQIPVLDSYGPPENLRKQRKLRRIFFGRTLLLRALHASVVRQAHYVLSPSKDAVQSPSPASVARQFGNQHTAAISLSSRRSFSHEAPRSSLR